MGLVTLVGLLTWVGSALLLEASFGKERRLDLAERWAPFQRPWIADEAEHWLNDRRFDG